MKRILKIVVLLLWIAGSVVTCNLFLPASEPNNDADLIAYFPFDENADDAISTRLKGKVHGATPVIGIKGIAYSFDGIDDYIEIENSSMQFNFENDDSYSISFWVKPATRQNDLDVKENDILSKWVTNDQDTAHLNTGYPFCIRYLNQKSGKRHGKWYLANWGGYIKDCDFGNKIVSEPILSSEQFNHIVCTQNKTELKLYLNGNLVSNQKNTTMCTTLNVAPLRIGKRGGLNYQNHFAGVIDELQIYKVALDLESILEMYMELKNK